MKPRELLTEQLCEAVIADDPVEELALRLETYAIGRWVPVSERLPDVSQYYCVKINGEPEGGCWFDNSIALFDQRNPPISHWLELELPEVGK